MSRRTESALQSFLLENLNDAAIAIDKSGKVVIFNAAASGVFKILREDAVGKKIWDVIPFSEFNKLLLDTAKSPSTRPVEKIIILNQNRPFQIKVMQARQAEHKTSGAVVILRDLSEYSAIEKAFNEYVANISHELKTPLTAIKGYVETLLDESYFSEPEISKKFLQIINDETNRMTRLIVSMLERSKPAAQRHKVHSSAVSVSEVLEEALTVLRPLAEQKNIELAIRVSPQLPPAAAEKDRLKQILINLVDNAVKYTSIKKNGLVTVEARDEGHNMKISVSDSGIGIAPQHQDKIFERFYRVAEGPSSQLGGTGLGLSITKELVEEMNGTIEFVSTEGKGSKFTVILPLAAKD